MTQSCPQLAQSCVFRPIIGFLFIGLRASMTRLLGCPLRDVFLLFLPWLYFSVINCIYFSLSLHACVLYTVCANCPPTPNFLCSWGWLWTHDRSISASQSSGITGVYHHAQLLDFMSSFFFFRMWACVCVCLCVCVCIHTYVSVCLYVCVDVLKCTCGYSFKMCVEARGQPQVSFSGTTSSSFETRFIAHQLGYTDWSANFRGPPPFQFQC